MKLESKKSHFNIFDTPGHEKHIRNRISGISIADAAILMIDSSPEGYEAGWRIGG